ncbi:MAG: S-methyl-5'-thioadenosine phosphorylase [Pseudomonadota bacterium]
MLGVIGGSGLYDIDESGTPDWRAVESPWGRPSDAVLHAQVAGAPLAFLPRHGRGHALSPTDVPYRANIDAMKRVGVMDILSFSACGSFREEMAPGDFVIIDQFIDRTFARAKSFFGEGCVAHVSMAEPVCSRLRGVLLDCADLPGVPKLHDGGTYLAMEGPQFSTLAESRLYREVWGCDVIGMTNMPEAKLAREAEICYATVAMVTDYDSWHPDHGEVDIQSIIKTMQANVAGAKALLSAAAERLAGPRGPCPAGCDRALEHAIITAPEKRDPDLLAKLDAVAGRVLGQAA